MSGKRRASAQGEAWRCRRQGPPWVTNPLNCLQWAALATFPQGHPRGGRGHRGNLAHSLGQLAPSHPTPAREPCPCGHRKQGSQSIRGTESPLCGYKGSHSGRDPAGDQLQPRVGASGGEPKALLSRRSKDLWVQLLPQALLESQQ